jgi:DNA-binding NarL/FixJ family response regulator
MQRILLVSQPGIVRDATIAMLQSAPGLRLSGTASGALSATQLLTDTDCDLLLVDATLPQEEMLMLLRWLRENHPQLRCAVMTTSTDDERLALAAGAHSTIRRACLSTERERLWFNAGDEHRWQLPAGW